MSYILSFIFHADDPLTFKQCPCVTFSGEGNWMFLIYRFEIRSSAVSRMSDNSDLYFLRSTESRLGAFVYLGLIYLIIYLSIIYFVFSNLVVFLFNL